MSTERTNEIEEIASDWLIRGQSGQWSEADQGRLEQWLEAATLNRVAYLRLDLAWEDSARLKALGAGIAGDLPPPPGRWNLSPLFDTDATASGRHPPDPAIVLGDTVAASTPDPGTVAAASRRPPAVEPGYLHLPHRFFSQLESGDTLSWPRPAIATAHRWVALPQYRCWTGRR